MRRLTLVSAVVFVLLAGCSSDGSDKPPASTPSSTTTSTTTTTTTPPLSSTTTTAPVTTTTGACHPVGSTAPVTTATAGGSALLRAVRVTGERCADRVTFDFTTEANAKPQCKIAYDQPPFTMDASGAPVTVAGSAFVRVRCNPASGYDFENAKPTYTGPKRITATGTHNVRELVETGDFEAVLQWIIGLDDQRPFTVSTATVTGPQAHIRLVIRFF